MDLYVVDADSADPDTWIFGEYKLLIAGSKEQAVEMTACDPERVFLVEMTRAVTLTF